jgi:hypothetical protein
MFIFKCVFYIAVLTLAWYLAHAVNLQCAYNIESTFAFAHEEG